MPFIGETGEIVYKMGGIVVPPSITTFLYSDGFRQEVQNQQPTILIINPRLVFVPMFIPTQHSFAVTFGVMEAEVGHTVQYAFKNPSGETLIDTGKISLPQLNEDQLKLPPEMRGVVLNLDFKNVILKEKGTYVSEIFYDDVPIGTFPIKVRGADTSG